MRCAVLGSKGMLGADAVRLLSSAGWDVTGFNRHNLDFTSVPTVRNSLKDFDIVINCIAFTNVDLAESDPKSAVEANVEIPRRIVEGIGTTAARLINVSTDYVFSGYTSFPYKVCDSKDPLGVYGTTKSLGEDIWLAGSNNSQVIRTAWLYGSRGPCFPKKIAGRLLAGKQLKVVDDQAGSPTWTEDLIRFIVRTGSNPISSRIMHGVASGVTTRFGFARAIAKEMDLLAPAQIPHDLKSFQDLLSPISTKECPTVAIRPSSVVLEPSSAGDYQIPDWLSSWHAAAPGLYKGLISY